jgi:hypothetical protein
MIKQKYLIVIPLLFCLAASPALAISTGLEDTAQTAGLQSESLAVTVGRVLNIVYSFLGVILLVILIYAGILWMTAGGDENQVKKAKGWIINGIIGLFIILVAYAVTDYIVSRIIEATGGSLPPA